MRLAHHGAASGAAAIRLSQTSSSSADRQLAVGKAPMMPDLQAATTRSTPETRNIGAAISGRRRLARSVAKSATFRHPPSQGCGHTFGHSTSEVAIEAG